MTSDNIKTIFDWQSFIAEAAKDILCAVLPSIPIINGDFQESLNNAISNSIDTAYELIKQLKEKEENYDTRIQNQRMGSKRF